MKIQLSLVLLSAVFWIQAETIQAPVKSNEFNMPDKVEPLADGVLEIQPKTWLLAKPYFNVDANRIYRISAEAKLPGNVSGGTLLYGFFAFDKNGKTVAPPCVLFQPGSETELAADVHKGDSVIVLKEASKWDLKNASCIVYEADPSGKLRDLPNRNLLGSVAQIEKSGELYKLTLKTPSPVSLGQGVAVRQHFYGWGFVGCKTVQLNDQWQKIGFETRPGLSSRNTNLQWLVYTNKGTLALASGKTTVLIRNVIVEILPADQKGNRKK